MSTEESIIALLLTVIFADKNINSKESRKIMVQTTELSLFVLKNIDEEITRSIIGKYLTIIGMNSNAYLIEQVKTNLPENLRKKSFIYAVDLASIDDGTLSPMELQVLDDYASTWLFDDGFKNSCYDILKIKNTIIPEV